jgi:hypothetical protein
MDLSATVLVSRRGSQPDLRLLDSYEYDRLLSAPVGLKAAGSTRCTPPSGSRIPDASQGDRIRGEASARGPAVPMANASVLLTAEAVSQTLDAPR